MARSIVDVIINVVTGNANKDVKELLKYYNMTKRMMKGLSGNRKMRKNLMKQLQFGN